MRKRMLLFALALLMLPAMPAAAQADSQITITATFYPIYIATLNVCRDVPGVDVRCMATPSAGCLHDYQLTTADRRLLEDSDVVIRNGAGLEGFLDKLLNTLDAPVITASEGAPLLYDDHGDANAHVWVSVGGMIAEVNAIAKGLSLADPENAGLYLQNAADYVESLSLLRDEMRAALAPCADQPFITFHEAFDYLAQEFDLTIAATVQSNHDTAPSARALAGLSDLIRRDGVRALFAEPDADDASILILSRETGAPVHVLDPAASGEIDPPDLGAYIRVMRQNAATLAEALSR